MRNAVLPGVVAVLAAVLGCAGRPSHNNAGSQHKSDVCRLSIECVLATHATCCAECGTVYPFRPTLRAFEQSRDDELMHACALAELDCSSPEYRCAAGPPPGCRAEAVCQRGQCVARETGCARQPP